MSAGNAEGSRVCSEMEFLVTHTSREQVMYGEKEFFVNQKGSFGNTVQ